MGCSLRLWLRAESQVNPGSLRGSSFHPGSLGFANGISGTASGSTVNTHKCRIKRRRADDPYLAMKAVPAPPLHFPSVQNQLIS